MAAVPGLRSPYEKVGRVVYFGRMLDKIRLHAAGKLPAEYQPNIGIGFDGRCCTFLRVTHAQVVERVRQGGSDDEILAWCREIGGARTDDECTIWNRFMMKIGWRDDRAAPLQQRIREFGLSDKADRIATFFDLLDYDEGRDPFSTQPWLG